MWSIAHFITNNLNYFIPLSNLSIFCYKAGPWIIFLFKEGCLSIFFESQTCPAARMSEGGGSWRISQALCDQEDKSMLSFFSNQREGEWWRCADLQQQKQPPVSEAAFLKLSHTAVCVLQFSPHNISEWCMLQWRHQALQIKVSGAFLLFPYNLCWVGRREQNSTVIITQGPDFILPISYISMASFFQQF